MQRQVRVEDVRIGNVLHVPFTDNDHRPCQVMAIRHVHGVNEGQELQLQGAGGNWHCFYESREYLTEICAGGWNYRDTELARAQQAIVNGRIWSTGVSPGGIQLGELPVPQGENCFVVAGDELPRWRAEWGEAHSRTHYQDTVVSQLNVGQVFQLLRGDGTRSGAMQVVTIRPVVLQDRPTIYRLSVAMIHGRDRNGRMLVCAPGVRVCARGDYTRATDVARAGRCTTAIDPPAAPPPPPPPPAERPPTVPPRLCVASKLECTGFTDNRRARLLVLEFTLSAIATMLQRIGICSLFNREDRLHSAIFQCDECVAYHQRVTAEALGITTSEREPRNSYQRFERGMDNWLLLPETYQPDNNVSPSNDPMMIVTSEGISFQVRLVGNTWNTQQLSIQQLRDYTHIITNRNISTIMAGIPQSVVVSPQRPAAPVERRRVVVLDTPADDL